MENITKRFLEICAYLKEMKIVKNDSSIARDLGIRPSAISNIMSGSSKAELKVVYGVAKAYTMVNIVWLLTGGGEMILSEPETSAQADAKGDVTEVFISAEDTLTYLKSIDSKQNEILASLKTILDHPERLSPKRPNQLLASEETGKVVKTKEDIEKLGLRNPIPKKNERHKSS